MKGSKEIWFTQLDFIWRERERENLAKIIKYFLHVSERTLLTSDKQHKHTISKKMLTSGNTEVCQLKAPINNNTAEGASEQFEK